MISIAVFGYDFKHRKTNDFLLEISKHKIVKVTVFAAPFKKLNTNPSKIKFSPHYSTEQLRDLEKLCGELGFSYVKSDHDDKSLISHYVNKHKISLGIISGARILKEEVISLFLDGVINFHPGKIPETSGLDSFYYMVKSFSPPIVTTHLIDARVDAGHLIYTDEVQVSLADTPSIVVENLYQMQLKALGRLLNMLPNFNAENLIKLDRPVKNQPMNESERYNVLDGFPNWLANCYFSQSYSLVIKNVIDGDLLGVQRIINRLPFLLNTRDQDHRTLLMIAAFHQHHALVEFFINKGANPNAYALKGTTALMYAKTNADIEKSDFDILKMLLTAGADPMQKDFYDRDIFSYLNSNQDQKLINFLKCYK